MKITCPECSRRIKIKRSTRNNICERGHNFSHRKTFGDMDQIYLVDANIILYAANKDPKRGYNCKLIMETAPIKTTERVLKEIKQYNPFLMGAYKVKEISPEVKELKYNSLKELSDADRSLIQCAIDHPEIAGIITYDKDIESVVPSRLIKSEKKFFIGRPIEYMRLFKRRN
jgi:rRNA-processing protein FCF1